MANDMLKDYITVNERILKFHELYPLGRIITEIVSWSDGIIIMKAFAFRNSDDELPSSTGHAYEKEGSTYINKTSALENCETSVVGRCLANLGLNVAKGKLLKYSERQIEIVFDSFTPLYSGDLITFTFPIYDIIFFLRYNLDNI